ncbi:MAG TPA: hypothetical protein VK886_07175 [Vicinamibacterales bacterium]|nr:hypothetical protein [Vicinamibacterales bacterium]
MNDRSSCVIGVFVLALAIAPARAGAQQAAPAPQGAGDVQAVRDELVKLRQEFDSLRDDYQQRMAALEGRLAALEGRSPGTPAEAAAAPAPPTVPAGAAPAQPAPAPAPPATAPAAPAPTPAPGQPAPATVEVPAGAAGAGGPTGALPLYGSASALSKIFNPDIAVIGNFIGAGGDDDVDERPALAMDEAEASFQAIVDPFARADFFIAFGRDEVELEEGFLTLTALPGGLLAKVGKMKAQFGKANTLHPHQSPFVDQPLLLQNLLGSDEGLTDSGMSISKLILNPWIFLEATGEVFSGDSSVFRSYQRSDLTLLGRVRGYRDLTESANLDVGTSVAFGRNELGEDSRTRLIGLDATLRYRPLRRAIYRRLLARTELVWNRASLADEATTAFGMYVGGEYQFARRWFAGARYDVAERAFEPSLRDKGGSLLLTFWPSEFSQVRAQFRRTRYAEGLTGNQLMFQFLFSIGAHGAHVF